MVVVVGRKGCYMSYVAQRLLQGFASKMKLMHKIGNILSGDDKTLVEPLFPVVYIWGKLVGGLDRLIAIHISGELIPILKTVGAFWL
ncbi:Glutaredoxin and related proteins protein [Dioscorea alata]|uniref:Glutaredoxin and related proteins protein n=1 Tax=Dioscorea alata TaxID=55571 RepID=A0ACB7V1L0_DIOAL|nr:Glutaredoxin and related proteins protein [Dioscorea alata]